MLKPEYELLLENFAVYAILGIIILLILRVLNLWYWRINEIVKNQEEQIRLLKKIAGEESKE